MQDLSAKSFPSVCDILLTGGCVITVDGDRRVIDPGSVAINGDRISAVAADNELACIQAGRVIDCRGKAIIPGLIDGHTHLFQALVRGMGEGLSIVPWLCEFMWPYSIAVDSAAAVAAARLGAVEAALSGITATVDNHYAPTDADTTLGVAEAIEAVGLRGAVARGIVGTKTELAARRGQPDGLFRYSAQTELAITRECMQSRPAGSSVEVWPAPLNLTYVDQDLARRSVELAVEHGVHWHTHCCEGADDPDSYAEAYGIRPVEWLIKEGLLDQNATLAHAVWLTDDEVEAVAARGAGIAHNPTSNAYLASGSIRLRDLRDAGGKVALGTDGPSCGHRADPFECMKQAIFVQRLATGDPTSARCEEALELATVEGARYLGIPAGSLVPGNLADVTVVDLHRPHLRPRHRTVSTLVYSARGGDVETTIVGGRIIVEGGRCVLVDQEAVVSEAEWHAERTLAAAGLHGLREPWHS